MIVLIDYRVQYWSDLMKGLSILTLVGLASLFSMNAFAGVAEFNNQKTTCYVFNAGNLVKKSGCTYSGATGGNGWGAFFEAEFHIRGYGKISVSDSELSNDGHITEEVVINNAQARIRYRDANSLKTLNVSDANKRRETWLEKGNAQNWKNMGTPNYIKCYKQSNAGLELCYIDNW